MKNVTITVRQAKLGEVLGLVTALAAALVLMVDSSVSANEPVVDAYTRISYQGPWTVIENRKSDSVIIFNEFGEVHGAVSLVGRPNQGVYSSVDNTGGCLVHRYGEGTLTLYFFNPQGRQMWKKDVEPHMGPFILSPDGKFFARTAGPVSMLEVYRTELPNTRLPNPMASQNGQTLYHADFSSDNSLIVLLSPRTLYKVDPASGALVATLALSVPKADHISCGINEWASDHASNPGKTMFAEFAYGTGAEGVKLLLFDQSLGFQHLIDAPGYIYNMVFADSQTLLFSTQNQKTGKQNLNMVRDFRDIELVDSDFTSLVGNVTTDDSFLYVQSHAARGSVHYDMEAKRLIGKRLDGLPLFKQRGGKKSRKMLKIAQ